MDTQNHTRLFAVKDAAKYLNISTRKLWELTNRGLVASIRIGRAVRYDPADLDRYIDSCRSGGNAHCASMMNEKKVSHEQ